MPALLHHPPVACEGLDARIVEVVRAPAAGARPAPRRRLAVRRDRRRRPRRGPARSPTRVVRDAGALDATSSATPREAAALWRIREDGAGLAARSLPAPAHAGWEDAAVPPERLGAYLRGFDELLREHGLDGVPYGHFGDGCVHVRIDFPLDERRRAGRVPRASSRTPPTWPRSTAARCPASTATAGPAPSCCR